MIEPVSAREALIIEAIGEADNLIESVKRLTPELEALSRALDRADIGLRDSLAGFEAQLAALTERAKVQAVRHILARTDEAARNAIDAQGRAMDKAATQLFVSLVEPRIQQLAHVIAHQVERVGEQHWWAHAATALASSAATLVISLYLWPR